MTSIQTKLVRAILLTLLTTAAWAVVHPSQNPLSHIEQLHKEIERFEQNRNGSLAQLHQLESLAPDLTPNLIDLSDEPTFPNLSQHDKNLHKNLSLPLSKNLSVNLSMQEEHQSDAVEAGLQYQVSAKGAFSISYGESAAEKAFQYYSVKGMVHLNPEWFLVGSYSSLGAVDGKNTTTTTIYKEKTNSLLEDSNFKRVAVGFGWRPHSRFLTQIQVGEDRIDTASSSRLSLKEQNQERSFAGIETVLLF